VVYSGLNAIGRPATEYGLRRSNFYGVANDEDNVDVDRVTARFAHRFSDALTFTNDTRYSYITRSTALTPISCATSNVSIAAYNASCSGQFFRGLNPALAYTGGGGGPYTQTNEAIQNLSTALARFNTGPLRHELTAGVDIAHETVDRLGSPYSPTRPGVTILNPYSNNNLDLAVGPANNQRKTESTNLGLFMNERLYLTNQFSLFGGFRWTNYELSYSSRTPGAAPTQDSRVKESFFDPRAGVIWEPTPNQTYYYSYSSSTTPPGTFFTTFPAAAANFNSNLVPERNTNHEVGAKLGLVDNRLGVTVALFQAEKGNALVQDPNDPTSVVQTGDVQRIRGVEAGVTGRITNDWNINANYSYLDSETTRSTTAASVGKRVQYVPQHAASVWTTYDIARDTPWNATLGAGVFYRGKVFLTTDSTAEAPASVSLDALIQHRLTEKFTLRVNGYNLTDRRNYEGLFGNRAIVSAGRTVLFSLAADF
jgi:catecholate siderophore receptor